VCPIAPRRSEDHNAFLVPEAYRDAVDLELYDVADGLAGVQSFSDARVPIADLVLVIGVLDGEHRHRVGDGAKLLKRPSADAWGGPVRREGPGVLGLERLEPLQEAVEFQVRDDRRRLDIIQVIMPVDLRPQPVNLFLDRHAKYSVPSTQSSVPFHA